MAYSSVVYVLSLTSYTAPPPGPCTIALFTGLICCQGNDRVHTSARVHRSAVLLLDRNHNTAPEREKIPPSSNSSQGPLKVLQLLHPKCLSGKSGHPWGRWWGTRSRRNREMGIRGY